MMAKITVGIVGWLIASVACTTPSNGQDFLKQLENRLRDAAGKQQEPPAQPPSDTQETSSEVPTSDSAGEELPVPGNKTQTPTRPRSSTIVISPRKQRPTPRPAPSAEHAESDSATAGYLGLTLEPVAGGNFGLAVVEVVPQSPAWKSGFRIGDRVVGVGGKAVTTIDQFASELQTFAPAEPIKFLVQRQGRTINLTSILQDRDIAQRVQGNPQPNAPRRPATPYQPISGAMSDDGGVVLGVSVSNLSDAFRQQFGIPVYRGAAVSEVVVGSAAERAGIQPGDCIVEIDGRMVLFAEDVVEATRALVPGQSMWIGFYRGIRKIRTEVAPTADSNAYPEANPEDDIDRDMLKPEYVDGLHAEIARLREELESMQRRVQELESQSPTRRR